MQAFLHFSSSHADKGSIAFIEACYQRYKGQTIIWLSRSREIGIAACFEITQPVDLSQLRQLPEADFIDINLLHSAPQVRQLVLCDMDSTIITGESLDELSTLAGIGAEVSAITARAMAGEIDFRDALAERLSLLTGESASLLDQLVADTKAFDGAAELVGTMRAQGATCLLVSGGFTFLTSDIAARFGFNAHFANELALKDGLIAGYAHEPIIDSSAKLRILNDYCKTLSVSHEQVMSLGDGANDIPMLSAAGLGIAWQAKPLVRETIAVQLSHSTLCGPLFLQGLCEKDIVSW